MTAGLAPWVAMRGAKRDSRQCQARTKARFRAIQLSENPTAERRERHPRHEAALIVRRLQPQTVDRDYFPVC